MENNVAYRIKQVAGRFYTEKRGLFGWRRVGDRKGHSTLDTATVWMRHARWERNDPAYMGEVAVCGVGSVNNGR